MDTKNLGLARKYTINENFFKEWTKDSAYVFGWIVSDGCLYKNPLGKNSYSIIISLKENDKHILESISNLIGSNKPLYHAIRDKNKLSKGFENSQNCWKLNINSKPMALDLIKLGLKERKSMDMRWSDFNIPQEFMSYYLRGFFEGDGSIFYIKRKDYDRKYIGINFTGTKEYLEGLRLELNNILGKDYGHTRSLKNGLYYQLVYSGDYTIKKLLDWFYIDSTEETRLKRKYDMFVDYFKDKTNIEPQKTKNTKFIKSQWIHMVTAWNETKSILDWLSDDRCLCSSKTTLSHRLFKLKITPEHAIGTKLLKRKPITRGNHSTITKSDVDKIRLIKNKNITNKSIAEELGLSIHIINDVVANKSWHDEEYVPDTRISTGKLYFNLNGNKYSLKELSELSGVPYQTIDRRIRGGMCVEDAINPERLIPEYKKVEIGKTGMTIDTVKSIRTDYYKGLRQSELLELYNLKKSQYIDIIGNRTWKSDIAWWKEEA